MNKKVYEAKFINIGGVKEFIAFDKSGHFPSFEEPEKFNSLVVKILESDKNITSR